MMNVWKKAAAIVGIGTAIALTGGVTSASAAQLVAHDRGCEFMNTISSLGAAPGGWYPVWWIDTYPTANASTSGLCRATGRLDYLVEGDSTVHYYAFNALNNQRNPDMLSVGDGRKNIRIIRQAIVACYGEECGNWVSWSA